MKLEWKRFWRAGSFAAIAVAAVAAMAALISTRSSAQSNRHNELTLAGLRPGKSKLAMKQRFPGFDAGVQDATGYQWANHCDGRIVRVEIAKNRIVRSVMVSTLWPIFGDCVNQNEEKLRASLKTGRGLELGDACVRVTELYGKPESRGPSVQGSHKLESLFYSFDWAGEDVPQSMEISCDSASGHVVEITLASSTL